MERVEKMCFSTENCPHLGNGERYGQGYYISHDTIYGTCPVA